MKNTLFALLALFAFSTAAEAATVCTVGDSITAAGKRMRTSLKNDYHTDWTYVGDRFDGTWYHDGVAGDTTLNVLQRFDTIPQCDIALVLIGTNDWTGYLTVDQTLANLQRIVDRFAERGTQVYLMRLLPRFDCSSCNQRNITVNQRMVTEITGATILNTWRAINASQYPLWQLLYDGLHPSSLGYDEIVAYIGPLI